MDKSFSFGGSSMGNKVMKRIAAIIIITFLFTGCTKSTVDKLNQYGFQPPIDELYWGMSLKDIEDALSIQKGVEGVKYIYDNPTTTIMLPKKIKKFNYEATVCLNVSDAPDVEWFPYKTSYLIEVKLFYTNINTQKLKKNMIKEFGASGEDTVNVVYKNHTTWQSKDKISDLESVLLNRLNNYWSILDEHFSEPVAKAEDESINDVILSYGDNSSSDATVTYFGGTAIPINKYCIEGTK
jgi:hypothetical protein